jgi:O-antigen/teichoic acid export membrane protein
VPLDGGFKPQHLETRREKWMGTLSALSLGAALIFQVVRMIKEDNSIPFTWIIFAGILFILFDVLRRIFRGNQ